MQSWARVRTAPNSRRPDDLVEEFEVERTSGPGPGQDPVRRHARLQRGPDQTRPGRVAPAGEPTETVPEVDEAAQAEDPDGEPTADAALEAVLEGAPGAPAAAPRLLRLLTWGLVPSWAKDRSVGSRMINSRAGVAAREAGVPPRRLARRCLVPADGWYEWQKSPTEQDAKGKPRKQPFCIHPASTRPSPSPGSTSSGATGQAGRRRPRLAHDLLDRHHRRGAGARRDPRPDAVRGPRDRWDAWLDPS